MGYIIAKRLVIGDMIETDGERPRRVTGIGGVRPGMRQIRLAEGDPIEVAADEPLTCTYLAPRGHNRHDRRHPLCDCGACCDGCRHDQGCSALIPDADCTCPEEYDEHAENCPAWQAELAWQAATPCWPPQTTGGW